MVRSLACQISGFQSSRGNGQRQHATPCGADAPAICAGRGQNASQLAVLPRKGASSLARRSVLLQNIRLPFHNFGELPIRRPNRAPPTVAKDGPRTNDEIRNAQIQLIDADGVNKGTVETMVAIKMAMEAGMDLVEISPNVSPPVCKIMDYGKYKYSAQKKAAEARKKQKVVEIKEIKLRPMIDDHDYDVKMRAMQRFFEEGDKVKITLRYRGREMAHQEIGTKLLDKVKADVAEFAKVEQDAKFEGRQVVMVLAPR
ncbi:translation initiation factor IF-3 [Bradyrhizobium sp. USDA 4454]